MKVLLTTDTIGGVWSYALELARALPSRGVEVTLATMGSPLSVEQQSEVSAIPGLSVHTSSFNLEWMNEPWHDVERAAEWLLDLEDRLRPDVVHLNSYAHGALPWHAPVLIVGHSCVVSWWEAVYHQPIPESWNEYRRQVTRGLQAATLVVAPSAAMLSALNTHYGPLPATRVVPNGRDPARFTPAEKEPFVFSAGRLWDAGKNVTALDTVAPVVPWPVYVAGEMRSPDGSQARYQNIRSLGPLAPREVANWLGRAAIYASPARYEPFGLSTLEAALAGSALILGDIPSLREIWGDAALFVSPDDTPALKHALLGLIAAPEERGRLAKRGWARAFDFTHDRMAESYFGLYAQLVDNVNAGRELRPGEAVA
jgi:glycogen synthase